MKNAEQFDNVKSKKKSYKVGEKISNKKSTWKTYFRLWLAQDKDAAISHIKNKK